MAGLSFRMFKGDIIRIRIRGMLLRQWGAHNRAGNANAGQGKSVKCYNCNGVGHVARNSDECDAFDSDVDDELTAQTIFMANLSSAGVTNQDEHEIYNEVQQSNFIDSTSVYIGNRNVIPYEQYLSVNNISIVPSWASSTLNNVCVSSDNDAFIPHDPIANELKIYKEQVAIYEQRAKFELTEREQRMDDQMRMLIQNRNKTEENLKKELHSVKLQLNSTMENNKIIEGTVTTLKQELKQKESKFLTDFSNLKHLNDKLENKLHSQDQSIQTVHMMLNPTQVYDQKTKTALGAQNPFYLRQAKKAQPALYDGDELLKPHHVPVIVPSSEEELELAEATRNKLHVKMNDSACVEKRVNITPPNYSKENFMATFTPQTQLTPEQVFWSLDLAKRKAEELKANAPPLPVLPPATVYPPNTPVHLVPRTLPTTSQVNIGLYVITQLFWDFEKTCKKRITPTGITEGERGFEQTKRCYLTEVIPFFNLLKEHFDGVQKSLVTEVRAMKAVFENLEAEVDQNEIDLKSGEIERKNLLITNENLIAECLSKDVFYTATDSVLNVSRFSDMHDAFTIAQKRIADLESENFNLRNKIQNDDHDSMIKHFSKLEVEHFNLQLSFKILKKFMEQKSEKNSDADPTLDLKVLVSQNKDLTANLNALYDLNGRFRAENAKAQLKDNSKCVTIPDSKPKVLAPETLHEIVEEAKVERPLDTSLVSTFHYTQHSQELLEYVIDTCPKDFSPRDKQNASTNSLRKKRVTFVEPCKTSTHNTPPQVEHQKINLTNGPGIPSTGVKGASAASRSKPRSNMKKDRTLPAKSTLKQVEAHSRMNKSNEKQKNHQFPTTKVWRVKQVKQVWKATGKLFTTIGHQWRPTGRLLLLGDHCPLTRNTPPKVLPTKQWKPTGRLLPLGRQCPLVRSTALKSDCMPADPQETIAPFVQIVLWYLDSGYSKHMTGDRSRLRNFVKKFIETVIFRNDHFGAIMGYGDYVIGGNLEVTFRKHTCFVKNLDGVDLIKRSRGTNLYTISVDDMMRSSPICLLSKASKNKSWLWHRRLNHLNFGTLNDLARKDLVRGLPRLKFEKDHLCSACQLRKSRKATHKPKTINTIMEVLHTIHMDLCGPMRVQSINGKKYIQVIVDDYFRFTWVKFLRSKDETPAFVINLLKQLQVGLNKTVRFIWTDNGTEFVNKDLIDYYENIGITHEKTVPRTPQQNGIVERRNRTLVEAGRTMLIFSKAPLFL
ncbi:retrovirus-related pol polyprotein from transposon TNT 1-94 [Tanacetum coccineum]